ncbi:hypothetical protein OY671_010131, partial [Metschnikowia pulcherrima]
MVALRQKRYGVWQEIGWQEYADRMIATARASSTSGAKRGDRIAIIAANRVEWLYAELGIQAIGAFAVGIYSESTAQEISHIVSQCDASVIFAEDQEQVDKSLELGDRAPHLKHIVYSDPRGMRKYNDPRSIDADTSAKMGRDRAAREPQFYDQLVDATKGDDVAILCTTSGT